MEGETGKSDKTGMGKVMMGLKFSAKSDVHSKNMLNVVAHNLRVVWEWTPFSLFTFMIIFIVIFI